ncbi:MAG: VTT domain-containing protein [Bacteroidota bacterium]|nr:VTT domain-containing protein [Bacteroidota bacterium]
MENFLEILKQLVNPESIIVHGGLYLLLFVIFAETGLFFGFFLPGDSLVFTSGLLCATGLLPVSIPILILLIILAAVLGNFVGYLFGKKVGVLLFRRKSSFFFKHQHLVAARVFYYKHGGMALIICRFLPIVRTFAPIVAGIVKLNPRRFLLYNVIGAVLWINSLALCGYFLGIYVPNVKDYLGYIIIFLVVITTLPVMVSSLKRKRARVKVAADVVVK